MQEQRYFIHIPDQATPMFQDPLIPSSESVFLNFCYISPSSYRFGIELRTIRLLCTE
jgi:hypothetical protein